MSKLADTLDSTHPDIAVARVNCENAVHFCDQVISISRTPSFKVGRCTALGPRSVGIVLPMYLQCTANALRC